MQFFITIQKVRTLVCEQFFVMLLQRILQSYTAFLVIVIYNTSEFSYKNKIKQPMRQNKIKVVLAIQSEQKVMEI